MTVEIAIMNREAIALAADSAATLTYEKIFTSASKIFSVSKYHPVGVMVHGTNTFMGIPWETIIKVYRGKLGNRGYGTLKEYAADFQDFLKNEGALHSQANQERYYEGLVRSYFEFRIKAQIETEIRALPRKKGEPKSRVRNKIVSETIARHHNAWKNAALPPLPSEHHYQNLKKKYERMINMAKSDVFKDLGITKASSKQLIEIALHLPVKSTDALFAEMPSSGLVFCGFGTKEIFPCLTSLSIGGMVENLLKCFNHKHREISLDRQAMIIPFAESDVIETFMWGVDPQMIIKMGSDLARLFKAYPKVILNELGTLDAKGKRGVGKRLQEISKEHVRMYIKGLRDYRVQNYASPLLKTVAHLPKDDLVALAQSLVHITVLKRKASPEAETVAGPVDVAVISKGDGFIWIKRKHYFAQELNPQFLANYYREDAHGHEKEEGEES